LEIGNFLCDVSQSDAEGKLSNNELAFHRESQQNKNKSKGSKASTY
jgi:hypothetical protein